nr:hypothetical protein [Tanacetum cinerariifolium]
MNLITTQQAALDNSLVAPEKRLKIKRCFGIGKTDAYDFKLDKKNCRVDIEVFCEILQICPQLPNQNFVELPSEDDLLSFIKELGYSGNYEMLSTIRTLKFISKTEDYQKYGVLIPDEMINEDIKLSTAYKTYLDYATRKVPPKKARKFKKPASPKLKTGESEDKSDGVHDEDSNDDDSEKDKSNDEEKMYEGEDDDVAKELYRDLNITQGLKDADMTNVEYGRTDHQNASHESWFVHEEEDAHVTLTTVHDKTEGPLQRSSVSSDFTSKLLNLDNLSPYINSLIDSFIRLDRGTKRRESSKDAELLKDSKSKESRTLGSSQGT